jgi:hypothetical protein
MSPSGEPADCPGPRTRVEHYNTTRPGTSRTAYLTLLETLQATCPSEERGADLTGKALPGHPCDHLGQENCTAHHDPQIGTPQIP